MTDLEIIGFIVLFMVSVSLITGINAGLGQRRKIKKAYDELEARLDRIAEDMGVEFKDLDD